MPVLMGTGILFHMPNGSCFVYSILKIATSIILIKNILLL